MSLIFSIMVIATMQTSEPITSNYQRAKFLSMEECQLFLDDNKIELMHSLIHALEDLKDDKLMDMSFSCVVEEGLPT